MIHLFINGLAASAGGGLTYLRNLIPHLSRVETVHTTLAVNTGLSAEFGGLPNVSVLSIAVPRSAAKRFWYEQAALPGVIKRSGADVLISAGNIALRRSPVPQLLLSRNSLYTSAHFFHDLRVRRDYAIWLDTRIKAALAARSIAWADCTIAPSAAFAAELHQWTGRTVSTIYHGFDSNLFFASGGPLSAEVERKLEGSKGSVRLLFVSHYNYYRNFETLLRAVSHVRACIPDIKLLLTCRLEAEQNPGRYRPQSAATLIEQLRLEDNVVQLGAVPYAALHQLYRAANIYVTPAYAESFAHPLVEAMATGLPIVASDIAVHREICGNAALYFPSLSAGELTREIMRLAEDPQLRKTLSAAGQRRALDFSWHKHVCQIIQLAVQLKGRCSYPSPTLRDRGKVLSKESQCVES